MKKIIAFLVTACLILAVIPSSAFAARIRIPIINDSWWQTLLVVVVVLAGFYFARRILEMIVQKIFSLITTKTGESK